MLIRSHRPSGFTIVELLVVIVVIGILATIVIVAYSGVQTRGQIATIQSDLQSNVSKVVLFTTDNNGPPATATDLQQAQLLFTRDPYRWVLYCSDDSSFVIAGRLNNTNRWWIVGSNQPVVESTLPGVSGSDVTTCANLGFGSGTHRVWIKSGSGWAF